MKNRFKNFNDGELELLYESLDCFELVHRDMSDYSDEDLANMESARDEMKEEIEEMLESRNNVY